MLLHRDPRDLAVGWSTKGLAIRLNVDHPTQDAPGAAPRGRTARVAERPRRKDDTKRSPSVTQTTRPGAHASAARTGVGFAQVPPDPPFTDEHEELRAALRR